MIRRCDLVPQYEAYKDEIDEAIQRVLTSGVYVLGPEVTAFEKEFAAHTGVSAAAGVANATDGLILALKALGIGAGDEVLTTPFTAIPTLSAIVASGAIPIFIDIEKETYLIDLGKIKEKITSRTKAVVPVHLFGNVVDIAKLKTITGEKIAIVEDAAQAHGSKMDDHLAGSQGHLAVFSFYPTKNLGGYGDGGAVVSNNHALIEKIKLIRMYGMTDKDHIVTNGVNSRLDELQAAILRIKLKKLDDMNRQRNVIARFYIENLRKDLLEPQTIRKNVVSNYHVFSGRFKKDREKFSRYLDQAGIQTNVYYPIPLHLQKAHEFLGKKKGDFPVAEKLCDEVIALPMYPELPMDTVKLVVDKINAFN